MKKSYILFVIVWIPLILYWMVPPSLLQNNYTTIFSSINTSSKSPAGEIDDSFELKQTVKFEKIYIVDHLLLHEDSPLCLDILMANYGDRRNRGDIKFIIKNNSLKESKIIDVKKVKDNTKHKVCFEHFSISDIQNGQFELTIKGINSPSNKSVTVWLDTNISFGNSIINGKPVNKSLIFSITRATSKYTSSTTYLLILFAIFSSIILIHRNKNKYTNTLQIKSLDIKQTTIFKGIAILMITMHNYFHWIEPKPGENEFDFNYIRFENYINILMQQTSFSLQATFSYFGHYGVQIFLFLSAYGLTKKYNNEFPKYFSFIWRRILKIYPTFLLAIGFWAIFTGYKLGWYGPIEIILEHSKALLYKLTFISNFIPGEALNLVGPWWFVSLIIQFYLFFPLLLKIEQKFYTSALIYISLLSMISTPLIQQVTHFNVYYTLIAHLPEFSLGIYLAKKEKTYISIHLILFLLLLFILGNTFEIFWYFNNISILLLLIILLQWLIHKMGNYTLAFFTFLGTISMYIFYTNGFIRHAFALAAFRSGDWFEIIQYGIGFFATVILFSSFLYWIGKWLSRFIFNISFFTKRYKMNRAIVFVHYDRHNIVDPYVYHYLEELQKNASHITFVSTAKLQEEDIKTLSNYCSEVIVRENIGYDFMSYKVGLESFDYKTYDEVLICNDSVYGPLYPMQQLFEAMQAKKCDFWGITDNTDMGYHIQSYFMLVKKSVLQSSAFEKFWDNVEILHNKDEIIQRYEIGFSQSLINEGFIPAISTQFQATALQKISIFIAKFTPTKIIRKVKSLLLGQAQIIRIGKINTTHYFWKELLLEGDVPFIKIELLRDNPMNVDIEDFEAVIHQSSHYDTTLITKHLKRMKDQK